MRLAAFALCMLGLCLFALGLWLSALAATRQKIEQANLLVAATRQKIEQAKTNKEGLICIHWPQAEPCPDGFVRAPDLFRRAGKSYSGCVAGHPGGTVKVDYLLPGEGMYAGFKIAIADKGPVIQ